MNVLLIGSGGREHALAWKISQSDKLNKLFIAPGNAGTRELGVNIDIDICDFRALMDFSILESIQMIVVGPELPLVKGITDFFHHHADVAHILIIGPNQKAAQLEGSKDFAKHFMQEYKIPTAAFRTIGHKNYAEGVSYLNSLRPPYVLKADGLASGKGVFITEDLQEAQNCLHAMIEDHLFGGASKHVIIESYLQGIEVSVFVALDGKSYVILPEAKDYKRIGDGDTGLNTGGMGSVSPVPFADAAFMAKVEEQIIKPTLTGLNYENIDYRGFLFIGIMNCQGEPYVIEYNCRLGDPETQSILPLINNDFIELLERMANGTLDKFNLSVLPYHSVSVVLASKGYPGNYPTEVPINCALNRASSRVFHSGTALDEDDQLVSKGGRVLTVNAMGQDLEAAIQLCYHSVNQVEYESKYYRSDIGRDLVGSPGYHELPVSEENP